MVERCDVMAVAAHPDDLELGCGGTLARLAAAGKRVGMLDLTRGELSTRGDVATRRAEAEAAAHALGVAWRACLDLPDGAIAAEDPQQLAALVAALRAAAPRAVLLPHAGDPHPDHGATAELVRRGVFLAGLARWRPELGQPHRPRLLLAFPGPRQLWEPDLVVDVTASYAAKRAALAAHASQFDPAAGIPTHISTGHYLAAVEGRDRACGNPVDVELGEGLAALGPLSADEVTWLLGRAMPDPGLRTPDPGPAGRKR